ncbi:MAG TPA: hypothetical protein PK358_15935 [Spirochaetota bacterium]|nr:hypothetical protein [Spirochaetota bacterium]HPJ36330.1 hypothetical protein [Spirochaetota bacterium]
METLRKSGIEKDQEVLLNTLARYLQRITKGEPEKAKRVVKALFIEVLKKKGVAPGEIRYLGFADRAKLVDLGVLSFIEKAGINDSLHTRIRSECLGIYKNWDSTIRVVPGDIDSELNSLVDDLVDKGILSMNALSEYYKRQRKIK